MVSTYLPHLPETLEMGLEKVPLITDANSVQWTYTDVAGAPLIVTANKREAGVSVSLTRPGGKGRMNLELDPNQQMKELGFEIYGTPREVEAFLASAAESMRYSIMLDEDGDSLRSVTGSDGQPVFGIKTESFQGDAPFTFVSFRRAPGNPFPLRSCVKQYLANLDSSIKSYGNEVKP